MSVFERFDEDVAADNAMWTTPACPLYENKLHRNTETLIPASYALCKCGARNAMPGARRFA